jgi:hypothetical protein
MVSETALIPMVPPCVLGPIHALGKPARCRPACTGLIAEWLAVENTCDACASQELRKVALGLVCGSVLAAIISARPIRSSRTAVTRASIAGVVSR